MEQNQTGKTSHDGTHIVNKRMWNAFGNGTNVEVPKDISHKVFGGIDGFNSILV